MTRPETGHLRATWYRLTLVLIGLVGVGIRSFYVFTVRSRDDLGVGIPSPPVSFEALFEFARRWGDSYFFYYWPAVQLANGRGFLSSLTLVHGAPVPSAAHPPGFIVILAALYKVGIRSPDAMRYAMCFLGGITVVLVGVVAGRLVSRRVGIIAASLAALYPNMWINDTMLLSETPMMFGLALGLTGIYAFHRTPTWSRLMVASIGLTIAASTRPENLLLFAMVIVPLVLMRRHIAPPRRVAMIAFAALPPLLVFVPWSMYNSSRFSKPVLASTGFGQTLMAGTCDTNFSGTWIGYYSIDCANGYGVPELKPGELPDESVNNSFYIDKVIRYLAENQRQIPAVVTAREARMVGLWNPSQQATIDRYVEKRGSSRLTLWSQRLFWVLGTASVVGLMVLRRRRVPIYPMIAIVGVTVLVEAITFGNTRYRAPIEVCVVILAAIAIDEVVKIASRWSTDRRGRATLVRDPPDDRTVGAVLSN